MLAIPTNRKKKKLVRYLLWKLEKDASTIEIAEDSFSIEHILPESPSEEWRKDLTDSRIEDMVYRLGNLTPLEPSINRHVGNSSYSQKREQYPKSAYTLSQQILAEDWTLDTIARRQETLASRAAYIWKTDFPLDTQ